MRAKGHETRPREEPATLDTTLQPPQAIQGGNVHPPDLVQVDTAWRGLVIDLVLVLAVTAWWHVRVHEPHRRAVTR